jgi:hypothetical protein
MQPAAVVTRDQWTGRTVVNRAPASCSSTTAERHISPLRTPSARHVNSSLSIDVNLKVVHIQTNALAAPQTAEAEQTRECVRGGPLRLGRLEETNQLVQRERVRLYRVLDVWTLDVSHRVRRDRAHLECGAVGTRSRRVSRNGRSAG